MATRTFNTEQVLQGTAQDPHSIKFDRVLLQVRVDMLERVADAIEASQDEILAANDEDMQQAKSRSTDANLIQRLQLKPQKLKNLCAGIRSIANQDEPLRKVRLLLNFYVPGLA